MHLICTAHFHPPQVVYIDRPIHKDILKKKFIKLLINTMELPKYSRLFMARTLRELKKKE